MNLESWHLIHDGSLNADKLGELTIELHWVIWNPLAPTLPDANSRVFLYLDDEKIKFILPLALERNWDLALLPHPKNSWTALRFGLERDVKSALINALTREATSFPLLTCNQIPVFSSVVAGQAMTLDTKVAPSSRWTIFKSLLKGIGQLRPIRMAVTTGKEQKITTAGIGVLALTGPGHPYLEKNLRDLVALDHQRTTLLLLAPRSGLNYLSLLVRIIFLRSLGLSNLPDSVGLFRSKKMVIEAGQGIDFTIDGTPMSAPQLELELSESPLRLRLGGLFPARGDFTVVDKDVVRVAHLPSGESVPILSNAHLPFFSRASEDEFRDLFLSLKESALLSRPFLALMVMSALLAIFGLYANSAPVIIGAMILAPLMGPIISLSMGLARSRSLLIRDSVRTLLFGIFTALLCAMTIAAIMPLQMLTGEMQARLSPNLLDLGVAVVSGIAGAYANAKEEIAKSLAGVAIAVALVPPLCVAGIGMGWMDWNVVRGALLLFVTNLVGITVAGSLTFLALGFAPFRMARAGVGFSLALLATVSIPLYFAFDDLIQKNRLMAILAKGPLTLHGRDILIEPVAIQSSPEILIRLRAISSDPLNGADMQTIQSILTDRLGKPVSIEVSVVLRRPAAITP